MTQSPLIKATTTDTTSTNTVATAGAAFGVVATKLTKQPKRKH